MTDFKLDLDEIDRDVALLKLTDAAGVSLEQLPEKLAALAARIREQDAQIARDEIVKETARKMVFDRDKVVFAQDASLKELERENAGLMKAEMIEELDAQDALLKEARERIATFLRYWDKEDKGDEGGFPISHEFVVTLGNLRGILAKLEALKARRSTDV